MVGAIGAIGAIAAVVSLFRGAGPRCSARATFTFFRRFAVFRFALTLVIAILWLAGCATPHLDRPEIAGLHRVTTPRSIVLNEPLYWRVDGTDGDIGLAPGVYTSDEENAAGTFFQGPKLAYFWMLHDRDGSSIERRSNAGIWVPKNGGPARLWVDFDHGDRIEKIPLGRRIEPSAVAATSSPAGTVVNPPLDSAMAFGSQFGTQQIASGQLPATGTGIAAASIGGVVGGALGHALFEASWGRRSVSFLDPPASEKRALQQMQALTHAATTGSPQR